jgi:hypothetical protein
MRTFWLSFCGPKVSEHVDSFRGVCVIDVSEAEAFLAREHMTKRFPHAPPGGEWLGAALNKAWKLKCNPGGDVNGFDVTGQPEMDLVPRNMLLSRADLELLGQSAKNLS